MYDGTDLTGGWLTVASGGSHGAHVAADFYEGGTVSRITQWFLPLGRWYSKPACSKRLRFRCKGRTQRFFLAPHVLGYASITPPPACGIRSSASVQRHCCDYLRQWPLSTEGRDAIVG